jgi:hypothetical protein
METVAKRHIQYGDRRNKDMRVAAKLAKSRPLSKLQERKKNGATQEARKKKLANIMD